MSNDPLSCRACRLHETRTRVVLPDGQGPILAIGEGPGADEDAQGVGFVGSAGRTLDKAMASVGIAREAYARANVVRCRPPGNRAPRVDEKDACASWLDQAIEAQAPRVLLAVGESAAKRLIRWPKGVRYLDYVAALLEQAERDPCVLPLYRGVRVVPMPHTSGLAWNRRRPDGTPIRDLGMRSIRLASRL